MQNVVDAYNDRRPAPRLLVDVGACPDLFAALSGGCTTAKNSQGGYIKEKNHSSHVTEALEYGASFINSAAMSTEDDDSMSDLLKTIHTPKARAR